MNDTSQQPQQYHVFIGVPSRDSWKAKFCMSLIGAITYASSVGIPITISNERYASPAENRNSLIKRALDMPAVTHVLFLDDDHTFPHDLVERLLSWKKDVVGVAYARKRFESNTGQPLTNIVDVEDNSLITSVDPTEPLQEVGSVGGGTLLVKRNVLEVLTYPYFEEILNKDGTRIGEDVFFCRRVLSYGYKIYVDTALSILGGHIGDFEYKLYDGVYVKNG
jgi:hypothetical protein